MASHLGIQYSRRIVENLTDNVRKKQRLTKMVGLHIEPWTIFRLFYDSILRDTHV